MSSLDELKLVLIDGKKMELMAEENCAKILEQLKVNGLHDVIEHIKNDERRHAKIVDQLLGFTE